VFCTGGQSKDFSERATRLVVDKLFARETGLIGAKAMRIATIVQLLFCLVGEDVQHALTTKKLCLKQPRRVAVSVDIKKHRTRTLYK